jgi:hypothetical protein
MHNHRKNKKSYNTKPQTRQICQSRKKNITLLKLESEQGYLSRISSRVASISSDCQLSPKEFDKEAHEAMLEMLSIDAAYYRQVSKSKELT